MAEGGALSMAPRRRFFSARDGLRLSALDWEGPAGVTPLLCLPGLSRTALDFVPTATRQAAHRRVVALDYAGHGESERAADLARYSIETTLRDVLDAMAALRLPRAVVLGTSLGGMLGMVFSVMRPGALAGLILNDSGPRMDTGGLDGVRGLLGGDPGFATIADAAAFMRRLMPPTGIPEDGWNAMAESTYRRGADGLLHPRWDTRLVQVVPTGEAPPTELWPFFSALAGVPVMLIWGQESLVLRPGTVQRMRAMRPDMAFVTLPGIGHSPQLELPAARDGIDRFLGSLA